MKDFEKYLYTKNPLTKHSVIKLKLMDLVGL